ncbi:SDR family oxidoreductase [Winogradskya humida]|uniref:3-ketoacyl-ACP reductase n=1 Tax=Winogradskya humida TaxID=113566 RepID=A0ABQ3ZLH2_9ACTN|nr:SDR family oxidoreductase [Actinoplanes humidus]GIE19435.1 3-ketoacyl-ACP reductase [Actinoplanes humidus]
MSALKGKTALITGGSRGIGAEAALMLAEQGADVAFTYVSSRQQADELVGRIAGTGARGLAIQADSIDPAAVTSAVERAAEAFGQVDILVNNAAATLFGPIGTMSVDDIDRVLAINVRSTIVAVQAALGHMPDGGRIITVGSNVADRMPFLGGALYAASKSALQGLNRGLARELGPRNITAVVVQPGPTDTDGNPADAPHAAQAIAHIALGRYGQSADIAAMIAYLAGEGGRHVTGTTITIDGGLNA